MSYYTPIINVWNTTTLPVGVTGTALVSGDIASTKMLKINAWTVPSGVAVPCIIPTYKIYNSIVPTEFASRSPANQQLIRDIFGMGTVDASPGTNVRTVVASIFSNTVTLTNLAALVAPFDNPPVPWVTAPPSIGGAGLGNLLIEGDLVVAGLS